MFWSVEGCRVRCGWSSRGPERIIWLLASSHLASPHLHPVLPLDRVDQEDDGVQSRHWTGGSLQPAACTERSCESNWFSVISSQLSPISRLSPSTCTLTEANEEENIKKRMKIYKTRVIFHSSEMIQFLVQKCKENFHLFFTFSTFMASLIRSSTTVIAASRNPRTFGASFSKAFLSPCPSADLWRC